MKTRSFWVGELRRLALPVLKNGAAGTLKANLPVFGEAARQPYAPLEAAARLLCGLAPFLEAEPDGADEAAVQAELKTLAQKTLGSITDPASPDRCIFGEEGAFVQCLVDAGFLALAVLRAPNALGAGLPAPVRENLIAALRASRATRPAHNNWLLFSATAEAALHRLGAGCDLVRADYALAQHAQWYLGDGVYGDGPAFHFDYYNSYVIHPMMAAAAVELAGEFDKNPGEGTRLREVTLRREGRYAEVLAKTVAPDGSFPALGRSLCYRCGALHALGDAVLRGLPLGDVSPAAARAAMDAALRRTLAGPASTDAAGWLVPGLCGRQPGAAEGYISTGSLYLCSTVFLPLGLPASDPFWSAPDEPVPSAGVWAGRDFAAEHALCDLYELR